MEWINVDSELPNFDFEVLACDNRGNVSTFWYRCNEHGYKYWADMDDNEPCNIIHWMPLPMPPKSLRKSMYKI